MRACILDLDILRHPSRDRGHHQNRLASRSRSWCDYRFFGQFLLVSHHVQGQWWHAPRHASATMRRVLQHRHQRVLCSRAHRRSDPLSQANNVEKGWWEQLRAKGGETRGLIGVIRELIAKYLDGGVPLERAMGHTGQQVVTMYACLSRTNWCPVVFESASIAFMKGMVWLERFHAETGRSYVLATETQVSSAPGARSWRHESVVDVVLPRWVMGWGSCWAGTPQWWCLHDPSSLPPDVVSFPCSGIVPPCLSRPAAGLEKK